MRFLSVIHLPLWPCRRSAFLRLSAGAIPAFWPQQQTPRITPAFFVFGRWMTIARISNATSTTPQLSASTRLGAKKSSLLTAWGKSPPIQATLRHQFRVSSKIPSWHTRCHISSKQNRLDTSTRVRGILEASLIGPERGWWLLSVGSIVELRRVICKFAMCGERRPRLLQNHRRFMAGWCGGKTVCRVYPVEEVSSFVEELYLVLLCG